MSIQDLLYKVINYFHEDGRVNRFTLGLDKVPHAAVALRWRIGDVILLAALFVGYTMSYWFKPFERQFYLNDLTILHPFAEVERVGNAQLFFYAAWLPLSTVTVVLMVITKPKNKLYVTFISLIGLSVSILLTSVMTDVLKNFIGRCRPDFLARCVPREGTPRDVMVFAKDVCTTDNLALLQDGFRTTPLGHSSLSFAGLGYLTLWLSGQFVIASARLGSFRAVVAGLPAFGATLIALSRTEDYRHHFIDVVIGSTLGMAIAWWSYRRYFPAVSSVKPFEPYMILEETEEELKNDYERLESQSLA